MKPMKKTLFFLCAALAAAGVPAQGRDAYAIRQVHDELQRVLGQVNVLQTNVDDLSERLARLERPGGAGNEIAALKSQIAALESTVARLRGELQSQRGEIVRDLSSRLVKMMPPKGEPKRPRTTTVTVGPHREYTVVSGDTLSIIAVAFNTTVSKIKEMNGMRNDILRVGQKIKVPLKD